MDVFAGVKKLMRKERAAHVREISKIDAVLEALGENGIGRPKRTMSAAARKKIGDAQRKRWAKQKKNT
jgi:hypothetical protein